MHTSVLVFVSAAVGGGATIFAGLAGLDENSSPSLSSLEESPPNKLDFAGSFSCFVDVFVVGFDWFTTGDEGMLIGSCFSDCLA